MGLYVRQDDKRSELQSKIITDLQQKMHGSSSIEGSAEPGPRLLENQHETRTAGVVIGLLLVALICIVLFIIVRSH